MSQSPGTNKVLSAKKRLLLDELLKREGLKDIPDQIIPRRERESPVAMSFAQERLWFFNQLSPGNPVYNNSYAARLEGELDVALLDQSLNAIIDRHETLRTTFATLDDQPVQIIAPSMNLPLNVVELAELPGRDREAEARRLMTRAARHPFNLARGPLVQFALIKMGDHDHILIVTLHHIVSDGWSIGVFLKELTLLYEAFITGKPSPLSGLPIQYGDFALWHRRWLEGDVLATQVSYWKQKLAGASPSLALPFDRSRPAVQRFEGAKLEVVIPQSVSEPLKSLSQREGATLFIVLLAAFKALLYRYTGQEDLLVGMPVAGRSRPETEGLIGCFVNMLVLRTSLRGTLSFQDLLGRVRDVALEAYAHQDAPFEKLVEQLQPERDLSRATLFQVIFVLQNAFVPNLSLSNLKMTRLNADNKTAKFDLKLDLLEEPHGLAGVLEYDTDLFDPATIERMRGHLQSLLEALASDPRQRICQIPMLNDVERDQLLVEWNETRHDYDKDGCIHHIVEARAEQTPNAIAVVHEAQCLTYAELNSRANQLAHYLRRIGVGPEVLVPLYADRSIEMIIGLLGILKAGGAYVPLDAAQPKHRLAIVLNEINAPAHLTQENLRDALPEIGGRVICLDTDWKFIEEESGHNPVGGVEAENTAYVIFTSGSTGTPKGVAVEHRQLLNYVRSISDRLNFKPGGSFATVSTLAADLGNTMIFPSLYCGGALHVVSQEKASDPVAMAEYFSEHEIDFLKIVPSHLAALIGSGQGKRLLPRTGLVLGGETTSFNLIGRLKELSAECSVFNHYGPTETTVGVLTHQVNQTDARNAGFSVPLGRPICNTQIYLLDKELEPVPIGVSGELHIGGAGLARGYLNHLDLTAEKFIPNPFDKGAGARLYRSGDLARYLPDGNVEFLGRIDGQVKIRGFRIEIGEIVSTLLAHEAIEDAVVLVKDVQQGERQLLACVVAKNQSAPTPSQLRTFVREKLPGYMVPSGFIVLDELPLTPNGKVDNRALRELDLKNSESNESFLKPYTDIEQALIEIWKDILKIKVVGVEDNFFEIGGHSLLATRLASRIRQVLKVELPLRRLFESPTISALSQQIRSHYSTIEGAELPPIKPVSREGKLPLSFAQQRLWFLDQLDPGSSHYNVPVAVTLRGRLDERALEHSLNRVIARHETLRTAFIKEGGEAVQVIAPHLSIDIEEVELRQQGEQARREEAAQKARQIARRGFDLSRGPLMRASLMRVSEGEWMLVVVLHHIVSDGWSMGVLISEMRQHYEREVRGIQEEMEELKVQYADYAVWQREWMSGDVFDEQMGYWRQKLAGIEPMELGSERARGADRRGEGARQEVRMSLEVVEGMKELGRREAATLYMVMLAGMSVLMMRYSGKEDIAIGTPIANRRREEVEGLIGFFVNTLVMRNEVRGDESAKDIVKKVRECSLEAYAHQDMPFERLVEELQPERRLGETPLFQVMFVFQNAPASAIELQGLQLQFMPLDTGTAKFDLTFMFFDRPEGLSYLIEYDTNLFDAMFIERMSLHFQTLLEGITNNTDQSVSDLPLLTVAERCQLLAWNETGTDYARDKCVHELFEAQAALTPDAMAIVFEDERLTYGELNRRANQLAWYLKSLGVGPEARTGIFLERSADMIVSLLATLKAGGAYLPLSPEYPKDRLAFMLQDGQVKVVLLHRQLMGRLPAHPMPRVCLDSSWEEISQKSEANLFNENHPDNLAYVMYTSGSTGWPKGVSITHRNVARLVNETGYASLAGEVFLQFAPISFDASTFEIWGCLLNGSKLVLMSPPMPSLEELGRAIRDHEVTTLWLTAGLFHQMVEDHLNDLIPVRQILAGGDVLSARPVENLLRARSTGHLINGYGPTESTTFACCYTMSDPNQVGRSVPIGRPIANTQVYVLDKHLTPLPVGVQGELYIGGDGLGRDYLNHAELTAERFIPNPFSSNGARLYKTGDLVKYRVDGSLEFLGRSDHQVKVRGYRIDPGEIENALREHPSIEEAVIMARENEGADKQLLAYLVARQNELPSAADLRSFLRQKLPDYMVPAGYIRMDALPLNANGKLDRSALPHRDPSRPDLRSSFVAPSDHIEQLLSQIWADLLNVDEVGVDDNFFDMGGHSLLATRLASRIRQVLKVELPLRRLFESPTISALSKQVRALRSPVEGAELPPIEAVSREGKLPLSFAQQRLWFLDQLDPGSSHYNVPVAVTLRGRLDERALEHSLNRVIARHETLRTAFIKEGGEAVQVISPHLSIDVEEVELVEQGEQARREEAARKAVEIARRGFDLSRGPLMRASLMRVSEGEWMLVVVLHHIVSDGWSMGVLISEMRQHYEWEVRGIQEEMEELKVQYADYAVWQREWMSGEVFDEQMGYWKQKLAGIEPMELGSERARGADRRGEGARQEVRMSREVVEGMKELGRREAATLYMVMLAGMNVLMMRYSGKEDVAIGTPIANRRREEVEGLIGFFVNTLVMRNEVRGDESAKDIVKKVRECSLEAYGHQDVPFERLVEELQPERRLGETPLFQVMFVFQNAPKPQLELPDLTLTLLDIDIDRAKFDLYVIVTEDDQELKVSFIYDTELFSSARIARMMEHYKTILQAIIENPDAPISRLQIMAPEERQEVMLASKSTMRKRRSRRPVQILKS